MVITRKQKLGKLRHKAWEYTHTHTHIYGKTGHNWDPKVDRTITLQTIFFWEANLEVQEGSLLKNNNNNVMKCRSFKFLGPRMVWFLEIKFNKTEFDDLNYICTTRAYILCQNMHSYKMGSEFLLLWDDSFKLAKYT